MNIYFARVGTTSAGNGWYKLSDGKGKTFGRRFCIHRRRRRNRDGEKGTT